jgi:hypothetical protein
MSCEILCGDVLDHYAAWPAPAVIISDGAYGVTGFPGDPASPDELPAWYTPHLAAWSRAALPNATLWFWGTEIGWATMHPQLVASGWLYRGLNVWDKGLAHVAGNTNTLTLRRFPVSTEVCAHYVREVKPGGVPMQRWIRQEWTRTGLTAVRADAACGVGEAASRKYLARGGQWYCPPPAMLAKLAAFANAYGDPAGRPYFEIEPGAPTSGPELEALFTRYRAKFHCPAGWTNVWNLGAVRASERLRDVAGDIAHGNQKPLGLMEVLLRASSDEGDVVWEPFGGLCTATVAASLLRRHGFAAELLPDVHEVARRRLRADTAQGRLPGQ